jgi:tripartite ATP-independent transporter DctP family solute receptor
MIMRKTLAGCLIAGIGLMSTAWSAETLRVGGVIFGNHSSVRAMKEVFIPGVEKATEGRYKVQLFINGELGGNAEMVQQVRNGTIFGTLISSAWVTSYVPELGVTGLPFLFLNRDSVAKVMGGPLGKELEKALMDKGFWNLGFMELGFRHLTNGKRPVTSPEDIKGLKIRLQANPVHIETFKLLGASTAQVDGKELFPALSQGVIDGQENPYSVISMFKIPDAGQKYLTETGHFYDLMLFAGSKRMMESMSEKDRKAVLDLAAKTTAKQLEYAVAEEATFKQDVAGKGVQITSLSDAQRDAFRKATLPMYEQTKKSLDAGLVDRFSAAAKE